MFLLYFLLWTLLLYVIHRIVHVIPIISKFHLDHHLYIRKNNTCWKWNNLFLYNDTTRSTIDLWITEVIPTLIFSTLTGQWWIFLFYYIWAALIQERIEHNSGFNLPILTSGKWHLVHHRAPCNYGIFHPLWDIIFKTYKRHDLY